MALDIKNITEEWAKDQDLYDQLGKAVVTLLKSKIATLEILPEISYRTKELLSIIKKIKKKLREKDYDYTMLTDKVGIRIICSFKEDMDKIHKLLLDNFTILKEDLKKETLDFNKLDYTSNHYDATIDVSKKENKHLVKFKGLVFEIQVRTLNQHAWSNVAHGLSYKQEAELLPRHKRRMYRLLSLYEIADDEFSAVNNELLSDEDNLVYQLLRKLESKIYKYAQVDYDRETSIDALKKLLSFLSDSEQRELLRDINDFINSHDQKIQRIFDQNRVRYHEIPFLTQPEIFVVWWALEHYPFSMIDPWDSAFDALELERIQSLWGTKLN